MRFLDVLATAWGNLRQRLFRTSLTILGVVVGTMAVVVMLSIGYGLSAAQLAQMSTLSLRQLEVVSLPDQNGYSLMESHAFNESTVKELAQREGVEIAWGRYDIDLEVKLGNYSAVAQVNTLPHEAFAALGLVLADGKMPDKGELKFLYGAKAAETYFLNYMTMTADVDPMKTPASVALLDPEEDDGMFLPMSTTSIATVGTRFTVPTSGVLYEKKEEYSEFSSSILADRDALTAAMSKANPGKPLPNQQSPYASPLNGTLTYSSIILLTKDAETAGKLYKQLVEEKYGVSADIEYIQQLQEQGAMLQFVLGGIGFISLFVAAIGIANTMLMSVYERTREIGIVKVLGASLSDIRKLFIVESASIGFFGGLLGVGASYLVSMVINRNAQKDQDTSSRLTLDIGMSMMDTGTAISIIPWALGPLAILGATLIGTIAGLAPAYRAMRLSPLEAIRTQ